MSGSPAWKVYNAEGKYRACAKSVEEASAVVAMLGDGATIKWNHTLKVWTEGVDGSAYESYDHVTEVAHQRVYQHQQKFIEKHRTLEGAR